MRDSVLTRMISNWNNPIRILHYYQLWRGIVLLVIENEYTFRVLLFIQMWACILLKNEERIQWDCGIIVGINQLHYFNCVLSLFHKKKRRTLSVLLSVDDGWTQCGSSCMLRLIINALTDIWAREPCVRGCQCRICISLFTLFEKFLESLVYMCRP